MLSCRTDSGSGIRGCSSSPEYGTRERATPGPCRSRRTSYGVAPDGRLFRTGRGGLLECARRAGHTIAVLFCVYAKVLAQTQERAKDRIDAALREWNEPG